MSHEIVRVLSIDDSPSDARLIKEYLEEANEQKEKLPFFEVQHALTMQEALTYLQQDDIDIILTDLALPDSPAHETFPCLNQRYPNVPIVVLTGSSDADLANETINAGAEDVLFKRDLESSLIAHTLVYATQRRQSRRALEEAHDLLEQRVVERTAALEKANRELQTEMTERQKAEQILRESELKFRGVIERSADGIVITDESGCVTDWNAAAAAIFGISIDDALGRQIWEIQYQIAPDERKNEANRENLKAAFQAFHQTGQPFWKDGVRETTIQRPNGERRTIQSTIFAIPTNRGVRGASIVRDVTKQKAAENALKEAHEQFEVFMDALPGSVFINDLEGHILYANAYQREMFYGDDHNTETLETAFSNHLAERFESQNRRVLEEGPLNLIETLVCPDGAERTYRTTKFSIPRENSDPVIGGIALDITTQREIEAAYQRVHSQLQAIMDHSTAPITMVEPPNRYLMVNPAAAAILGRTVEEINGKAFHDILPPHIADQFTQRIHTIIESQEPLTIEDTLIVNGSDRVFMTQSFPIFLPGGKPYAVAGVSTDITERKQTEEALRTSNVELERFAHAVSHDLQEPLRTISGFLNLLQKRYAGQLDAKADQFINYAVEGAGRMKEMIDALLDLSRVARRGNPFEPTDCNDLLHEVLSALGATLEERGANVTYVDLPTVNADRVQLGQVFQNLISNAVKFQIRPDPQVRISAERRDNNWIFAVEDNGIGMDEEGIRYLFEPFQRLHTREEYPGTGMGLALCRRIVQRHGGQIWVESTPGEGSTFFFTLPAS